LSHTVCQCGSASRALYRSVLIESKSLSGLEDRGERTRKWLHGQRDVASPAENAL
jgi:hypothetical protein